MISMRDDKDAELGTEAHEDVALLLVRMLRIIEQQSMFVGKDPLCFLERHSVLASVVGFLPGIPVESKLGHNYIVTTT
jgi:hypothetical protein